MILPERDRPASRVELPVGDEVLTVHPDGEVELPARYAGVSARQVADELRSQGHLPPLPVVESPGVEEPHAYPCGTCGGLGYRGTVGCRACGGSGELVDPVRRSYR